MQEINEDVYLEKLLNCLKFPHLSVLVHTTGQKFGNTWKCSCFPWKHVNISLNRKYSKRTGHTDIVRVRNNDFNGNDECFLETLISSKNTFCSNYSLADIRYSSCQFVKVTFHDISP